VKKSDFSYFNGEYMIFLDGSCKILKLLFSEYNIFCLEICEQISYKVFPVLCIVRDVVIGDRK